MSYPAQAEGLGKYGYKIYIKDITYTRCYWLSRYLSGHSLICVYIKEYRQVNMDILLGIQQILLNNIAQSTGAVEYTDCFSAKTLYPQRVS